jgi:hypothetical protein
MVHYKIIYSIAGSDYLGVCLGLELASFLVEQAMRTVLPTGRNFGRKTQKLPHKNLSCRKKQWPNFLPIFQKLAEKWPNFFAVCTSHKSLDYLQKETCQSTWNSTFLLLN